MTYKFQQIKPQKARGTFQDSLWTDSAWSAENKEDGDRRIAQFVNHRGYMLVRFTGGKESVSGGYVEKTDNLPHLGGTPCETRGLEGTVLDGEIVAPFAKDLPGGKSKYVTAIMGSKPERAIQLQKQHGWLEYRVFDCLWCKGKDLRGASLTARRLWAWNAVDEWANKYAKVVDWHALSDKKHNAWVKSEEGLVFKHKDHTYGNEKLWVKLKKKWTADVVIMGFEPGKGKYAGSVGAIIMGQYGKCGLEDGFVVGTCRGFTDAQMRAFMARPKNFTGKVIEIDHNGREPTGAFRHPRFKKFRPDKSPADCVYDPEEM